MSNTFILFVFISALLWAKLEIEIEGQQGWAAGLPTWRVEKHFLLDLLFGGRPLTGYHFWSLATGFFLFHCPFFGPARGPFEASSVLLEVTSCSG